MLKNFFRQLSYLISSLCYLLVLKVSLTFLISQCSATTMWSLEVAIPENSAKILHLQIKDSQPPMISGVPYVKANPIPLDLVRAFLTHKPDESRGIWKTVRLEGFTNSNQKLGKGSCGAGKKTLKYALAQLALMSTDSDLCSADDDTLSWNIQFQSAEMTGRVGDTINSINQKLRLRLHTHLKEADDRLLTDKDYNVSMKAVLDRIG